MKGHVRIRVVRRPDGWYAEVPGRTFRQSTEFKPPHATRRDAIEALRLDVVAGTSAEEIYEVDVALNIPYFEDSDEGPLR